MESSEFYSTLSSLPKSYHFGVLEDKTITGTTNRGSAKGVTFNPLTAVADRFVTHLFDEGVDELGRELFEPDFVRPVVVLVRSPSTSTIWRHGCHTPPSG